jgi:23S rRNA (guanosine2251-2'-O)-methyltransferase
MDVDGPRWGGSPHGGRPTDSSKRRPPDRKAGGPRAGGPGQPRRERLAGRRSAAAGDADPRRQRPPDREGGEADERLAGPHAIVEALQAGRALNRIWVADHLPPRVTGPVERLARERGVPVVRAPRARLDAMAPERHQGMVAAVAAAPLLNEGDLDEILDRSSAPFVLILDGIQDPRNLGAIVRVADAAGVDAIVTLRHGTPGLTATVARAAAGATSWVPVVRVANLARTIDKLKDRGLFVWAADPDASLPYTGCDLRGPVALVVGAEGRGVRPLVRARADGTVAIPMAGRVGSLNAAAAAAVLAFEVVRQRRAPGRDRGTGRSTD